MYKILPLLFILSPVIAMADCQLTANNNACVSYDGCYLNNDTINNTKSCTECAIGYYNNTNSGYIEKCIQCPYGTTTASTASTAITQCYMSSSTKFCDTNGENCMYLIPTGTTIHAQ